MPPKLYKRSDDTVWRDHICTCGKTIYKKNLTASTMEILVSKNNQQELKFLKQKIRGDLNEIALTCAYCDAEHIVVNIRENIKFVDDVDNSLAIE